MNNKEGRQDLPQRARFGGGGRAIGSRQRRWKPCPHLSIINSWLPSPTGRKAAPHCVQERVVGGGDRAMGDGSRTLSSKCSTRWGGRLVMYGGDARRFSGGSGCTGRVRSLEMSSKGGVLGRWRFHRRSNRTAGISIPSSSCAYCGCLQISRASSAPGGKGPGGRLQTRMRKGAGGGRWRALVCCAKAS